nr:hypothetical protein CFP56_67643 [Quercus suber]
MRPAIPSSRRRRIQLSNGAGRLMHVTLLACDAISMCRYGSPNWSPINRLDIHHFLPARRDSRIGSAIRHLWKPSALHPAPRNQNVLHHSFSSQGPHSTMSCSTPPCSATRDTFRAVVLQQLLHGEHRNTVVSGIVEQRPAVPAWCCQPWNFIAAVDLVDCASTDPNENQKHTAHSPDLVDKADLWRSYNRDDSDPCAIIGVVAAKYKSIRRSGQEILTNVSLSYIRRSAPLSSNVFVAKSATEECNVPMSHTLARPRAAQRLIKHHLYSSNVDFVKHPI